MAASRDPDAHARQLANLVPAGPAPPGNNNATIHGGFATYKTLPVASVAAAIYRELEQETPLRDHDGGLPLADRTVVELLATDLARLASISEWIEQHGTFDSKGKPRTTLLELERRLRNEARDHCARLGLDPRGRVALGLDLQRGAEGFDLAQALSDLPDDEDGPSDG